MIQQTIFPFKIETTKERLTAHEGLALMWIFNPGIGLGELTDRYLQSPRSNRGFDPLVLMLQGGGRRLEDLSELKQEEGLMRLIGRDEILEPDTVGDWLRRRGDPNIGQEGLKGLGELRDKLNGRILKRDGIEPYTLDADATEILGEKADHGNKGYMPMVGYIYETGVCLYDEFPKGNVAPAFGQKEFYLQCKQRMLWGKKIGCYRADRASYQADIFIQLEEDGVRYRITADQDKAVKKVIGLIDQKD